MIRSNTETIISLNSSKRLQISEQLFAMDLTDYTMAVKDGEFPAEATPVYDEGRQLVALYGGIEGWSLKRVDIQVIESIEELQKKIESK